MDSDSHQRQPTGAAISDSDLWEPRHDHLRVAPQQTFIAFRKALEAAGMALALVARVPAPLKSLADQVILSAASVPANLAEGLGRNGRDRAHH